MTERRPLVRVVDASLGAEAQVRLVVSRVSRPDRLRSTWSSSGATLERVDDRIHATTTVEALARAAGRSLERGEAQSLDRALRESVAAWRGAPPPLRMRGVTLLPARRPLVMGVVNVTPDSFSDGGALYPDGHPDAAVAHGLALRAQGADLLDVGGESSRPGATQVSQDEELERVLPVVRRLAAAGAVVSIDTAKPEVARQAVAGGAAMINDVSGLADPGLLDVVARTGAGYVLMHTRGTPRDMADQSDYDDVVAEVFEFLADGLATAAEAGVDLARVAVDPGLGFAKDADGSLALLRALRQFCSLGRPVLVGGSRKSFLGEPLGGGGPGDRLAGSLAVAAAAAVANAAIVRVHDVAETVQAVRTARAIATGERDWPSAIA